MSQASLTQDSTQRLHQFAAELATSDAIAGIVAALSAGRPASIDGAVGSACALAVAALARAATAPLLIVCPTSAEADDLKDDLGLFHGEEYQLFPAWENDPGQRLIYDDIYADRLRALKRLMHRVAPRIVTSIQSLLQPVPPAAAVAENTRQIVRGQRLPADELVGWLARHGFHGTTGVELPGEFARRGGLVDVFAPDWSAPVRIEWFDDEIESLRRFDVASQRSLEQLASVDLTILPSGGNDAMRAADSRELLTAYLPAKAWCILVEPGQIQQEAGRYLQRQDDPSRLHGWGHTMSQLARFGHVGIWALASGAEPAHCRLATQTVERFSGNVLRVRDELQRAASGDEVYLICQTEAEIQRLREVFADSPLQQQERLHYVPGRLRAGFHLVQERALLLGGAELFQRTDLRRRAGSRLGKRIDSFLDLREGDLVVHLVHGIGRYRGLETLRRENQIEEHLIVEFSGGTRVYVPATKIELVQKYVGATKARPRLAKIGTAQWQKRRRRPN